MSPSQYGDGYFRLHSRHCVVKSRNKLLWPSVCRREENDHLTCLFQISDETNVLQDGTLIDLCGATLLWRSHEGLEKSPVSWIYVWYPRKGNPGFELRTCSHKSALEKGLFIYKHSKMWVLTCTAQYFNTSKACGCDQKLMIVYMFLKLQN